jgi:eukaryotic-like serine/threonine-protein kinase
MAVKIGAFQVLGTLGSGAHSTILHIRRSADGKQYALKVVPINGPKDLKFLDQAEHEFEVAQRLDHPNLIKVYALEKARTLGFLGVREVRLLIEYVNGKTLDKFPLLRASQLVQIFVDVASGMVQMHRRNICHADMKPGNIMLSHTGEVKVIDFGLAWIRGENKGRVQGTPEYMAPEQVKQRIVNEKTDIFNFGATMYRLVTFRHIPPVLTDGGIALDHNAWKSALKPVRDVAPKTPKPLAELIEKCLAYYPSQRPGAMSEIQGALDHLVDELVTTDDDKLEALEWQ